ncbi:thiol peroxidase [Sediminispirochaeta smaragdinae]|uniref:Thiol peroxidase n=1 Tax=Sediminispirochaeta smaragdinae (strain DSM 11293 / JCM 15392 / SEBR 4228) TaxID=573413 RepID=E1RBK2_SEDSS|nr:thiol peroxidase [Sediminispirochaeta smaragdinae]ADK79732.1 Redoxin domain protein [Sediminispirochaeta smaragdinae DSM 11293]
MEKRQVTKMGGNSITLLGPEPSVGNKAPDFTVLDTDLMPKSLEDYKGTYKLISVVPSLDTGVCDRQTRKFNEIASSLGDDVVILTISMDLPFAQKRWCGAAGVDRVVTLSDHKDADFGTAYGVLIEELRLLNRSIFIVDKDDTIRYIELVKENHDHPDYDAAVAALKKIRG